MYWGKNGQGTGTLTVSNGGQVITNQYASIAGDTAFSSTATVTGANSIWTVTHVLGVSAGNTLTVASGGTVTTGFIQATLTSLKGDGTINAKGLISDMNLVFDAAHGTNQVFAFGTGGVLNLSVDGTGELGAGLNGNGSMRIADGAKIASSDGFFGLNAGSTGTATVTGKGSTWNAGALWVGNWGNGALTVGGGGMVTAPKVTVGIVNSASTVNLHVSGDGMLVLGDGTTTGKVANIGQINFYADAFLAARTYSPITELQGRAITWSGTGSYNAYGGVWDNTAHTFTVAAAATSGAGASNTLTTGERLLITDPATGKRVGASFGTVAGGTNFSAAVLGGADLIGLPADQTVLGAWNFTTNFSGGQALLSFDIGAGQTGTLSVWHYDGSTWTPFAAPDLTYGDDGIANFAVTGFSGYAVTAAVPEPCSLALLALSGLALLRRPSGYAKRTRA